MVESSDSDTEVASDENGECADESENEEDEEDDEYEDEEEEEEECGGSTTEIETDSEFAEDPPNSVPGSIPTIIVEAPEQLVTKLLDAGVVNHTKHHHQTHSKGVKPHHESKGTQQNQQHPKFMELYYDKNIELVKKGAPERQLPVVTGVPKKWESLSSNPERLASQVSLELKKKYLQGAHIQPVGMTNIVKKVDPAAQNQFRSVLDMISEQQKLLQPASKPSATMQAFLDGADKLKNLPLNRNLVSTGHSLNMNQEGIGKVPVVASDANAQSTLFQQNNGNTLIAPISPNTSGADTEKTLKDTTNLIISSLCSQPQHQEVKDNGIADHLLEKQDLTPESTTQNVSDLKLLSDENTANSRIMTSSDTPSFSTSETESNNTVIDANEYTAPEEEGHPHRGDVETGSDTEVGSEPYSDLDDLDEGDDNPCRVILEPPRVEIEDEFGVTKQLDPAPSNKQYSSPTQILSSSDSSLNSVNFLETEMSDYVKDESSVADQRVGSKSHKKSCLAGKKLSPKNPKRDRQHHQKHEEQPAKITNESTKVKSGFDLEALDFADIDGGSSPEDGHGDGFLRQGEGRMTQNTISKPPVDIMESARRCLPESQSSSITSPSEDDERSSTSTRDPRDSTSEQSDSLKQSKSGTSIPLAQVKFHNDIFSSGPAAAKTATHDNSVPSFERVVPFSGARDSLDYRKTRGAQPPTRLRNKELYSTYSAAPVTVLTTSPVIDPKVMTEFSSSNFERDSGVPSLECGQEEPCSSLPTISSTTSTEESARMAGSPATNRKLVEIRQQRVAQNDVIRAMVLGSMKVRIKRSPDKTNRKNSKGSSSGTSLHSDLNAEAEADVEVDSRLSSSTDASQQYLDGNTSEECDRPRGSVLKSYQHNSSSDISSGKEFPHKPMAESTSHSSGDSNSEESSGSQSAKELLSTQKDHLAYEPVYSSSPKFRNRLKFDGTLVNSSHQPKTEPPTPSCNLDLYDMPYPTVNTCRNIEGGYTTQNPLFCRSMPNLVNFSPKYSEMPVNNDEYQADQGDNSIQSSNQVSQPVVHYPRHDLGPPSYEHPPNPIINNNSSSNHKINPFLTPRPYQPTEETRPIPTSQNDGSDDFINLHLRLRSKGHLSEVGNRTTEKARSVYSDSSKDYSDSGYGHSGGHPSSSVMAMSFRQGSGGPSDQWERNDIRPRSNTLTDLNGKDGKLSQEISPHYLPPSSSNYIPQNSRHSIDNSDATNCKKIAAVTARSKAFSSDTLADDTTCPFSANSRRTSVPDMSSSGSGGNGMNKGGDVVLRGNKGRKGKDRDRRRSLIQTVTEFFSSSGRGSNSVRVDNNNKCSPPHTGQASLTTSTSSSSIMSPTKDKFSIFKLTPKLLQNKERKTSKSRESVVSPITPSSGADGGSGGRKESFGGKAKTDFAAYLAQPDLLIQRLSSSPTNVYKAERGEENDSIKQYKEVDDCAMNMATLSMASASPLQAGGVSNKNSFQEAERCKRVANRAREIEEIQLQLQSIEADQRSLASTSLLIEKRLRGDAAGEFNVLQFE